MSIDIDVVTGTGSSGTTFFIQLLAELGLTNVDDLYYNNDVNGGYEYSICSRFNINDMKQKGIIKDPRLYFGDFDKLLQKVNISLVWLCYRKFEQASLSRIARGLEFTTYGGMRGDGISIHEAQIDLFQQGLSYTIGFLSSNQIPLILVDYNQLEDPLYCWKCITQSNKYDVTIEQVKECHGRIYNRNLKHSYK